MFFQLLVYIVILIAAFYIGWRFIVKPLLEGHGVEVEDEEVKTEHTKRLEKVKKEHAKTEASANAVEEELELTKDIKYYEDNIKKKEEAIEKEKTE